MFTKEEGTKAVKIAREVIENFTKERDIPKFDFPEKFKEKSGVFTTIDTFPERELRGCIGFPYPDFPLIKAIIDSSKSACEDPRFPKLKEKELDKIVIEVSLLTVPELIKIKNYKDYFKEIKIGKHGLIAERGFYRGLLLPQVPIEWKWDVEEFLNHTCMKAGLNIADWVNKDCKIYRFSAQIFAEKTPRGEIEERIL